jgi:L-ascorbate metabolism protein UlaG (beta-lactamase superfamily)
VFDGDACSATTRRARGDGALAATVRSRRQCARGDGALATTVRGDESAGGCSEQIELMARSSAMNHTMYLGLGLGLGLAGVAACAGAPVPAAPRPAGRPVTLTYLGVAGWQIEGDGRVILTDPYLSRPKDYDQPLVPDAAAIAAHTPVHADLVVVGHSHADHLLDAPAVALRTGAQLIGSVATARVARASGMTDDRVTTIKGGEDFALAGFSLRVIPSLHSAIGDEGLFGEPSPGPLALPMRISGYIEGGTFGYLFRLAGREILVLDTANFIERELVGLRPDIAIIAPGLREKIHDYTCRLLRALGDPPVVIATHFDNWQGPPVDGPMSEDLTKFVAEVRQCSPRTRLIIPHHFEAMTL